MNPSLRLRRRAVPSQHTSVTQLVESKTILPKCVACSVPQYNKPNARGACESGVYLYLMGDSA